MSRRLVVTPELMLRAYGAGLFPMAESRDDPTLHWFDPEERGILPLDSFHCPRRLMRTVRAGPYQVTTDRDFSLVIQGCAAAAPGREGTWINGDIESLFTELHRRGHAHSVECREDGALVGGLYGVSLGGAFFGESMFSVARDASKVALVHLVARLRLGGYRLLDTQFVTAHLSQFGARVPRPPRRRGPAAGPLARSDPGGARRGVRGLCIRLSADSKPGLCPDPPGRAALDWLP